MNNEQRIEEKVTEKKSFWLVVKEKLGYFYSEFIKFPAYILAHPLKGFYQFKVEKRAKLSVAITFMIVLVFFNILSFQYAGFEVNFNELRDLNSLAEISYIVAPILLFTVANWSITTLFDGKGKMKEIFLMICYSLYPMIWASAIGLVLSNVLTGEEITFYGVTYGIGAFLLFYMIFFGMISIHEYGLGKNIVTLLFTIIAAGVIVFVLILGYDLFQKMYGFLYTLYEEITLRDLLG